MRSDPVPRFPGAIRAALSWLPLRYFRSPAVQAGFPSPAADYEELTLDLSTYLVNNQTSTFYCRVEGYSLVDLGILPGDVVAVDRSLRPRVGKLVVGHVNGNLFVKVYELVANRVALVSKNRAEAAKYPPIYLDTAYEHEFWGCVTGVARRC